MCYILWAFVQMMTAVVFPPFPFSLGVDLGAMLASAQDLHRVVAVACLRLLLVTTAILSMARWLDNRSRSQLGLAHVRLIPRSLMLGLGLGMLTSVSKLLVLWGTEGFVLHGTRAPAADYWQYIAMTLALFSNAWIQEIVFRGYTFANLRDHLKPRLAISICGLIFLVPYLLGGNLTWPGALGQALTGTLLAWALFSQRSLWLSLWIHVGRDFAHGLLFNRTFTLLEGAQLAGAFSADLAYTVGVSIAVIVAALVFMRQRLTQKISQIDHISKIRDELPKARSIERGLTMILDGAMKDFNMDIASVFVLDKEKRTAETKAVRSNMRKAIARIYSLDNNYVEFECLKNKHGDSRIAGTQLSILGTRSVHSTPITSRGEVFGVLSLGSAREQTMDASDLSVLSLYSELVGTAFETPSVAVEPIKELPQTKRQEYKIDRGCSYLVEDDVDAAYRIFKESILSGMNGLCITRLIPKRAKERYDLDETPIVWLTDESVGDETTISSLQDLSIMISNRAEKLERLIVLIDGVEYLVSRFGFESVYQFLQTKRSQIERTNSVLIITLYRGALDPRQVKLLERELQTLAHT